PVPEVISHARAISDINSAVYPDGIHPPKADLNTGAVNGHFRYDRKFLLQFQPVCGDIISPIISDALQPLACPKKTASKKKR
ncbi:hypothetical protein BJ165DRAFT_1345028, partial [Panaeolus papilionaceus]